MAQLTSEFLGPLVSELKGGSSVSAKAVQEHLRLPSHNGNASREDVTRAIRELTNVHAFEQNGAVRAIRTQFPWLRYTPTKRKPGRWEFTLPISFDAARGLEGVIHGPLPDPAASILEGMALSGGVALAWPEFEVQAQEAKKQIKRELREVLDSASAKIAEDLAKYPKEATVYTESLSRHLRRKPLPYDQSAGKSVLEGFLECRSRALSTTLATAEGRQLRETVDIGSFIERYAVARSLGRRLIFHVGPTNSGKTFAALEALSQAPTGVYLAPLRLLALENYEALRDRGLSAGMITGEEQLGSGEITHLSQTIETVDLNRVVDVAVIDEIQMLGDRDRGWAWTNAIFGIPAKTVILCGSDEALSRVRAAAQAAGEPLEVVRFERRTPLTVLDGRLGFEDIEEGDAVIAFSRRQVLEYRLLLAAQGLSVSTVYGALSPEVRRAEAARFRNGETQVLVTTDAIGMGLNLGPLKRVIFTSMTKFDGTRDRTLKPSEIRQIAGRAGRFGFQNEGFAGSMSREGSAMLRNALVAPTDEPSSKFFVRPDMESIRLVADVTRSTSLSQVLSRFARDTFYKGSPFTPADLNECIEAAAELDSVQMPIEDKFTFAIAPMDRRNPENMTLLWDWARLHAAGDAAPAPVANPHGHLGLLEAWAQCASCYLWLARKFPQTFPFVEEALKARQVSNTAIELNLRETAKARVTRRQAVTA